MNLITMTFLIALFGIDNITGQRHFNRKRFDESYFANGPVPSILQQLEDSTPKKEHNEQEHNFWNLYQNSKVYTR